MNTKGIKFERTVGRKPVLNREDQEALLSEGQRIREADERDGSNEIGGFLLDEMLKDDR